MKKRPGILAIPYDSMKETILKTRTKDSYPSGVQKLGSSGIIPTVCVYITQHTISQGFISSCNNRLQRSMNRGGGTGADRINAPAQPGIYKILASAIGMIQTFSHAQPLS